MAAGNVGNIAVFDKLHVYDDSSLWIPLKYYLRRVLRVVSVIHGYFLVILCSAFETPKWFSFLRLFLCELGETVKELD